MTRIILVQIFVILLSGCGALKPETPTSAFSVSLDGQAVVTQSAEGQLTYEQTFPVCLLPSEVVKKVTVTHAQGGTETGQGVSLWSVLGAIVILIQRTLFN